MPRARKLHLDPIKYETFFHRLGAIGEEGRSSIQRVTASPVVSQGGECMASFYTAEGAMILACSGHLRFAAATSDAIKKLIEWYSKSPGFFDGDQFFFNDLYVAGAHTFDMMIIKPVFYRGSMVAWVSSSIHTADTGGVLRGLASEVYHEGIRIQGLKLVEKGEFREDVFRCLTQQCRDPEYVGLDLKSQIASNNVCAKRYIELIEKLGLDFVRQSGSKMIADSERLARARLRKLPDGKWLSRVFGTAWDRREGKVKEYQIACAMGKKGQDLFLDFTGTSAEMTDSTNSTLAGTIAQIAVVMTDFLFWNVPWSDGRLRPVKIHVPEGSILNCTFPRRLWGGSGSGRPGENCRERLHRANALQRGRPGYQRALARGVVRGRSRIFLWRASSRRHPRRPRSLRLAWSWPRRHPDARWSALRREPEHPLRWNQRCRAHRDAVSVFILYSQFSPEWRGRRQVQRRDRQLSGLHDLRLTGLQRPLPSVQSPAGRP